ncbi:hypothetical protein [Streptomyces hesseae]|uniref:Ig-like domain-containing protein n=1 Tax=Streptomyces hesseae TaxID=3075519 RepID=A0ABU2SSV9_9ACTN|nr:hypothetical protein [Streptomyces sp. DSM 40473]MDT0452066.1 hypothetical protein [Streptomyces sp. DSM 40473]
MGESAAARLSLSPVMLAAMTPVVAEPESTDDGGPQAGSEVGHVYRDHVDGSTRWYLPGFVLHPDDPDAAFAFTATQASRTASLSLGLDKIVPEDVQAAQQADSTVEFQEISLTEITATLVLHGKAPDGSDQEIRVPAPVSYLDNGIQVSAGLFGPNVILACTELLATGDISVEVNYSFQTWDFMVVDATGKPVFVDPFGAPSSDPQTPEEAAQNQNVAVRSTLSDQLTIDLGLKYAAPAYGGTYSLIVEGQSQVLSDPAMLSSFDVHESEYSELTSLGDVASTYPSLRSLYVGAVSGTVIAVPAAYGMVRTASGCAAECDAVVDTQPTAPSGCRFQMSFTLGPVVDPGDLARLANDLLTAPGLEGRSLHLTLPSDLDARTPPTFTSPVTSTAGWGVGVAPHTFLLNLSVTDDAQPAIVKTNLLLRQLAPQGTAPLLGRIAVRLDDFHQPPVLTDAILDLRTTSGSGELTLTMLGPGSWTVRNASGQALRTTRCTTHTPAGPAVTPYEATLSPGQTAPVSVAADTDQVLLDCTLALPDPITSQVINNYIAINAESVQQVHHWLSVNATGVPFADLGINAMEIAVALHDAPSISVPVLTLNPQHMVDSTAVDIPSVFTLTGLAATLTLTVTGGDPARVAAQSTVEHDFVENPIFVLTPDVIAAH